MREGLRDSFGRLLSIKKLRVLGSCIQQGVKAGKSVQYEYFEKFKIGRNLYKFRVYKIFKMLVLIPSHLQPRTR
jgi:hypothetical protein